MFSKELRSDLLRDTYCTVGTKKTFKMIHYELQFTAILCMVIHTSEMYVKLCRL